jgi:hypothetical protein
VPTLRRAVLSALLTVLLACFCVPQALAQVGGPWGACGASSPIDKPVQTFPAVPPVGGPNRTYASLVCGTENMGYRHIANGHGRDWEAVAAYTGGNWRDLADFAIRQTLTVPQPGYPAYNAKNDTWTYKAPLQIRDQQGNVRTTYWPIVAVASLDGRIITSFPTRDPK